MTAVELLRVLEQRGERIFVEGDNLAIAPGKIEDALFDQLRDRRDELKALVRLKHFSESQTVAERFRELFPTYGHWATLSDGWRGKVWGITPRGLIVRGLHDLLYTVDFSDVRSITQDPPRSRGRPRA